MKNYPIVYVLINDSMPNLYKIGKSTVNSLDNRIKCLSSKTGVPTPFKLLCYIVDKKGNGYDLESRIFTDNANLRVNNLREFFIFDSNEFVINLMKKYGNVIVEQENNNNYYNGIYSTIISEYELKKEQSSQYLKELEYQNNIYKELVDGKSKTIDFWRQRCEKFETESNNHKNEPINDKYKKLLNVLNEREIMIQSLMDRLTEGNSLKVDNNFIVKNNLLTRVKNYVKVLFNKG